MLQLDEWMKKKRRAVKNVSVNSNNKRNYFGGNQVIMALLATLLTILFWLILEMEENHEKNKNKTSARSSHRKLKFERKLHREKVWEQNEDVEEFITWIWFQLRETIMNFWTDRKNLSGKNKFIWGKNASKLKNRIIINQQLVRPLCRFVS